MVSPFLKGINMDGKTKVKVFGSLATAGALLFGATSTDVGKKAVSSAKSLVGNISVQSDSSQDKNVSGNALNLEGVSVGGSVGQIGNNTDTTTEGN